MLTLGKEVGLANLACAYVSARNLRYQKELVDQRCDGSEMGWREYSCDWRIWKLLNHARPPFQLSAKEYWHKWWELLGRVFAFS